MPQPPRWPTQVLTGLATLLLVLSIGFGLYLLVGAVIGIGPGGNEVAVQTQVDAEALPNLPQGAIPPDGVNVTVRVRDATAEQQRWAAGRDLAPGVVVIAITWLLRQLLKSVRDGDPFTERNVTRLRLLALIVLIGVPLSGIVASMFAGALATSAGLESRGTQLSVAGNAFVAGLAALVLAEVFAAGVHLRQDLEGTI